MVPTRETERRYTPGTVELRTQAEADGHELRVFHGYALKFAKLSQNLGGFVEQVAGRSTIAKTLADGGDVVARMHHKDEYLLGRISSGTLQLDPDDTGLRYDVTSPDTSYARDLEALARRGDIRHSSFAFRTIDDDWGLTEAGFPVRTLLEVQLVDVAPVVQPAYLDTSSSVRSLAGRLDASPDEVAELLTSGRLKDALKPGATHIDLGERKFNPGQPRANDGKWSDGPGGGGLSDLLGDADEDLGGAAAVGMKPAVRGDTARVDLGVEDGKLKVGLGSDRAQTPDKPVTLSPRATGKLISAVDRAEADVAEAKKQLKRIDRELRKADAAGDDDKRAELLAEADTLENEPFSEYEIPADGGTVVIRVQAGDIDASTFVGVRPDDADESWDVADDSSAVGGNSGEFRARDLKKFKAALQQTVDDNGLRAAVEATEISTPDALHVQLSVRARHLELMRRTFL